MSENEPKPKPELKPIKPGKGVEKLIRTRRESERTPRQTKRIKEDKTRRGIDVVIPD